jgi:Mlc titration factor MtfA (ptsG expression regulator)
LHFFKKSRFLPGIKPKGMLSRLLAIPLALVTLVLLILAIDNPNLGVYMAPPLVLLAAIYILRPQIDWWWYQKHPPKMNAKEQGFLERFSAYYQRLNSEDREKFRNRTMMIRLAKDFISQADDKNMPEDARLIFAASQAQATFGWEDYLLLEYEKVVVYPGTFPSPKYPEHFHASETVEEETRHGYIFSLDHAMKGFMQTGQYYPVMLHEICQSLILAFPDRNWPMADEDSWPQLELISGFPTTALKQTINRPDLEAEAVMLTYFLSFPERFQALQPDWYRTCAKVLEQDPLPA